MQRWIEPEGGGRKEKREKEKNQRYCLTQLGDLQWKNVISLGRR